MPTQGLLCTTFAALSTPLAPGFPGVVPGAGAAGYASGVDVDGEPWLTPPSIGCDEYRAGALTEPLSVSIAAAFTNAAAGHPLALTALIEGRPTDIVWVFGDGYVAINQPYVTHSWTEAGPYLVSLWAFNADHEDGVSVFLPIGVVAQPVCYVAAANTTPQPPFASWATAATNIQDALDAAAAKWVELAK